MKNALHMKQVVLALCCALGGASGLASAESNPADTGYLGDTRGAVVRSGTGLCWHTGTGPANTALECDGAPPATVAAPIPQALAVAAPAPQPQPVAQKLSQKVTLDADTLFDFNKAVLRPAGLVVLNGFADEVRAMSPEEITIVGHADRFGTPRYNQKLSEQRAEAVKLHLAGQGVAKNLMHAEGKGEAEPVTKAGECKGGKSAKVLACLQPDRRVEVEVTGTRVVR